MNTYEEDIEFREVVIAKLLAELENQAMLHGVHPGDEWEMQFVVAKDRACWVKKASVDTRLVDAVIKLQEERNKRGNATGRKHPAAPHGVPT